MKLNKYKNYIFDFDGTIVDLHVDWKLLKKKINYLCKKKKINLNLPFYKKIELLKSKDKSVLNIIKKFEQPKNKVRFKIKKKTINFISKIKNFSIVTNNLNTTVKKVLIQIKIYKKCIFILGLQNSKYLKPSPISFKKINYILKKGNSVFIGDKDVDKIFAKKVGIDFKLQKNINYNSF